MYLKKLIDRNVGPIKRVSIDFPFHPDGKPKPIVFVGENGSGKSSLLSNIVDAFYVLAAKHYSNALEESDHHGGKQYYKAISGLEIHQGQRNMYSFLRFIDGNPIDYICKAGELTLDDFKADNPELADVHFSWKDKEMFKDITYVSKVDALFENNVLCYFGPDRYEKPVWMGEKYYENNDYLHPSMSAKWSGVLKYPISVKNALEINAQWILDVITDCRVGITPTKNGFSSDNQSNVQVANILSRAKKNLERMLSLIIGIDVVFSLNNRSAGEGRISIVNRLTNEVVTPAIGALSTGQLALFNLFSGIIRYAEQFEINRSIDLGTITGIVVIDEIELHLHSNLQKEVLPRLLQMFPNVQFIITTHAPLFVLGMEDAFGSDNYEIRELPSGTIIGAESFSEFRKAYGYMHETQTFQIEIQKTQKAIEEKASMAKTLIITEGATDWKHMKTAYSVLSQNADYAEMLQNLSFKFLEYEPHECKKDSIFQLDMGNGTMTSICENLSKMPNETTYVFIADGDDEKIVKKIAEPGQAFKSWGNNVYSFVLPIPDFRKETPKICVEHLYSDKEIKTEIMCEDGIKRRLFIGNEFDCVGNSKALNRVCENNSKCGKDSIAIIDGSSRSKVYDMDKANEEDRINYAISKTKFAEYVMEHPNEFGFDAFLPIFTVIKKIIGEGNESNA